MFYKFGLGNGTLEIRTFPRTSCYQVDAKVIAVFVLVNFAVWYWNIFFKCGYVIHHFNAHFLPFFFANELLLAVYFIFSLDYGNDIRQKANLSDFLIWVSKSVVKQWRAFTASTVHLVQELSTIQFSYGLRSFAKDTRALKMRSLVAGHQKLTTIIESHHWGWSS